MSDRQSALPGASFDGAVRIEDAGLRGMVTLRGDLGEGKLRAAVQKIAGVEVPAPRCIWMSGNRGAAWMSPDELMILCPHDDAPGVAAEFAKELAGTHHLAADVSDARAVFRLTGPSVREVLAKLTPADMHPSSIGEGEIRRTRLAQVAAAFWFTGEDTVELVAFRSVAEYVFDLLSNAARHGAEVEFFERTN